MMETHRLKTRDPRADLLPWQAALMVVCVTMAGLLHEHPEAVGLKVAGLQTAQPRSGTASEKPPADVLNVSLWLSR